MGGFPCRRLPIHCSNCNASSEMPGVPATWAPQDWGQPPWCIRHCRGETATGACAAWTIRQESSDVPLGNTARWRPGPVRKLSETSRNRRSHCGSSSNGVAGPLSSLPPPRPAGPPQPWLWVLPRRLSTRPRSMGRYAAHWLWGGDALASMVGYPSSGFEGLSRRWHRGGIRRYLGRSPLVIVISRKVRLNVGS